MYQTAYAAADRDDARRSRRNEREALDRAIARMTAASIEGFALAQGREAILQANRVWSFLMEDLSLDENDLPPEVRANLISIGIYILRRLEALRTGEDADASDVIELMTIIRDAL